MEKDSHVSVSSLGISRNSSTTVIRAKKLKRMESKKKKLAAFLDLVTGNGNLHHSKRQKTFHVELSDDAVLAKKPELEKVETVNGNVGNSATQKSLDKLREELRLYQSTVVKKPSIYLTNLGLLGRIIIESKTPSEEVPVLTFSLQDVQDILLLATIGRDSFAKTRFCTLFNFSQVQTTALIIFEGISCQEYLPNKKKLAKSGEIFKEAVQLSILDSFYQELLWDTAKDITSGNQVEDVSVADRNCMKSDLLLSPIQMMTNGYPLPNDKVFEDFKNTKIVYDPVTNDSPLYALDCEMVQTMNNPRALARIAIVDENFKTIYDTFVIPPTKITNYLTEYSGITANLLKGVTKTLEEVQEDIQKLLPNDAILCGQSVNFDLICLKLFHPYIIDTSNIFNMSGNPGQKHKLKHLASYFLQEEIQTDLQKGHNPCEDSLAVMKLVSLKLNNKRTFGDVTLGWQMPVEKGKEKPPLSSNLLEKIATKNKKISISARRKYLKRYKRESVSVWGKVNDLKCKDSSKISESIMSRMWVDDLVIGHIKCDSNELEAIDDMVSNLFAAAPDKTLFLVIFAGNMDGTQETGLCMTKVKRKNDL